jgi:hypothetical protein
MSRKLPAKDPPGRRTLIHLGVKGLRVAPRSLRFDPPEVQRISNRSRRSSPSSNRIANIDVGLAGRPLQDLMGRRFLLLPAESEDELSRGD